MNTTQIGEGENKIEGQTLAFLIKLFKEGKITLGVDDDGFVFKNAGGHYPVEIYEDGHWDGSLSQGLAHQERNYKKTWSELNPEDAKYLESSSRRDCFPRIDY